MTIVIPSGYAHVSWRFTHVGDTAPMVFTCGVNVSTEPTTANEVAEAASGCFLTGWAPTSWTNQWTFIGTQVRYVPSGGGVLAGEHFESIVGSDTGGRLPTNCAYLVRKHTARAGRQGRGRMYIPPMTLPETLVDGNGIIDEATRAAVDGYVVSWFAAMDASGIPAVLLHDSASPGSSTPDTITDTTVDRQIATQRRRMR